MKIGILSTIENYEWAGTEEVWAQFAKVALQEGHQVMVAAHWRVARSYQAQSIKELGLQIIERRPFRPTRLYLAKEQYWSDMHHLQKFQPEILLINSGSLFDILNLPALRKFCDRITVPKVFFCHFVAEGLMPCNRERVRSFAQTIQHWVFVSEHNYQLAQRQLAQKFDRAEVILNAARLNLAQPLPWLTENIFNFACVARLETSWKGQNVLLEVLSQPQWRDRNWHLNLYGVGPDEDYIQQLIQHYQLNERVTCHGYIRDIQSVWQQNHLMVLASRGEGTPLAVLEAMMCGRPTVTTDVGGNREILEDDVTGFIAEVATPYSFGKILEKAWEERERWVDMGYAAHQIAKHYAELEPAKQLLNYLVNITINL